MENIIIIKYLATVALNMNMVVCDLLWPSGADVIRINSNGLRTRTIFLPTLISTHGTENFTFSSTDPGLNDHNMLVTDISTGNLSSDGNILNTRTEQSASKYYTKYIKHVHKIQGGNSSNASSKQLTVTKKKIASEGKITPSVILSESEKRINSKKIPKLLSLFTIVNFTNGLCSSAEGTVGVCYHMLECKAIGGHVHGYCAKGFGVCCYVERTCGEYSSVNNTYVAATRISLDSQNGIYICSIKIKKLSPDVQQFRLTFDMFELAGPVNGKCAIDRFIVTGQNTNDVIPPICGYNTGKHVYVDVNDVSGPVVLTLLSSGAGVGANGTPTNFKVLVTQLRSGDALLAPNNCLQYYTEPQGSFESFNYPLVNQSTNEYSVSSGYFNNLNYAICFKKLPGYCSIRYSNIATSGLEYVFDLVNLDRAGVPLVPVGQAGAEVFDCPSDYIVVAGLRLCGYRFNDATTLLDFSRSYPVTDKTNGPLRLEFHTNENVTGRGFHLEYSLIPCSSLISDPSFYELKNHTMSNHLLPFLTTHKPL